MSKLSRYYVLAAPLGGVSDEALDAGKDVIIEAFKARGVDVDAFPGMDRMILVVPDAIPNALVNQILHDESCKVEDRWVSSYPSRKDLAVSLRYDSGQIVSATVDEGLLTWALAGRPNDQARMNAAITALASENDFEPGCSPLNGNMEVLDITSSIEYWDPSEALRWNRDFWDGEEAMLEISFQPEADTADRRNVIPVHVQGMETQWLMPVSLLPAGFSLDRTGTLDDLASLPCAPEAVRNWARIMPFTVEILNPEVLPQPEDGPAP